jgi:hypothetical protein
MVDAAIVDPQQRGLDKSRSLAVGFRSKRLGTDVLETQIPAGIPKSKGLIATAVAGHNASNGDAEVFVIRYCGFEKRNGAAGLLIGQDLGEGDTGMVVNSDVDELPTDCCFGPVRSPVIRWPTLSKRPSFLISMWIMSPGVLSLVTTTGSAGSRSRIRFNPSRGKMRLTVAGDIGRFAAICFTKLQIAKRAGGCARFRRVARQRLEHRLTPKAKSTSARRLIYARPLLAARATMRRCRQRSALPQTMASACAAITARQSTPPIRNSRSSGCARAENETMNGRMDFEQRFGL